MSLPTISVVIASGAGGDFLSRCLDSVVPQAKALSAEVLVVDRVGEAQRTKVAQAHPDVRVLSCAEPERPSVPELRKEGLLKASGDVVAVIEEHCTAPAGWLEAIRDGWREGDAAIGGPILDDDFDRLRDWTVYFSEYHNYLPPWEPGERWLLNGANIAYDREKVLKHVDELDDSYWEVALHPRLVKDGAFRSVPDMGAHHTGPFDYRYYLRQRYLLSRVWGGTQRDRVGLGKRLIHLAAGPIFPFFLLARIARCVLQRRCRVGKFVACLPLLFPALCAYTWGEWLGYLIGPGDALEEVE